MRHPSTRSRLESCLKRSILHPSRAPCDSQLPTRIRPQALDCARLPRALRPQSRLQSGIKRSILHPSRAPCEPQFPTRIRPQALDFARLPRTLRPPDPDWNPAPGAHSYALPAHHATPSSRLESGLRRSTLYASRAPSGPSSRLQSGIRRSFVHASRAPIRPQLRVRIRPRALICARLSRAIRPQPPAFQAGVGGHPGLSGFSANPSGEGAAAPCPPRRPRPCRAAAPPAAPEEAQVQAGGGEPSGAADRPGGGSPLDRGPI